MNLKRKNKSFPNYVHGERDWRKNREQGIGYSGITCVIGVPGGEER